ncbi:MAG: hypothetical protein IPJ30_15150 [Acidobacteria bacterium]|nr:hypothetical protein [Acidobacteriota bacterium]
MRIQSKAYRRDNVGKHHPELSETQAIGFKFNFGRNNFFSSGQIPLDLVTSGQLDRFGAIDPENGGKVRLGTIGGYTEKNSGRARCSRPMRSSVDLCSIFSNFTFFLADPVYGDEIQQHDSRPQEGATVQFLQPYRFSGDSIASDGRRQSTSRPDQRRALSDGRAKSEHANSCLEIPEIQTFC